MTEERNIFEENPAVYIAMPLSDPESLNYVKNVGKMIKVAIELWELGYPCYTPCEDFLRFICGTSMGVDLNKMEIYWNSIEFLKRCDILYVPEMSTTSKGVQLEIDAAKDFGIPIATNLNELEQLSEKWRQIYGSSYCTCSDKEQSMECDAECSWD